MKLKVDIDNVIRDMGSEMVRLYNSRFGTSMTNEDIKFYDVNLAFPKLVENNKGAEKYFFEDNRLSVFYESKPMKDSIRGLKLAKSLGHEIILVSYQPFDENKKLTIKWLTENGVPYDALILLNKDDKTLIEADYIIDDNPKFLDDDSAKKVCIDWTYNREKEYDYRVKSIYEFVNNVLNVN